MWQMLPVVKLLELPESLILSYSQKIEDFSQKMQQITFDWASDQMADT